MEGHSPFGCPTVLGELAYVAEGSLFLLGGGELAVFRLIALTLLVQTSQ